MKKPAGRRASPTLFRVLTPYGITEVCTNTTTIIRMDGWLQRQWNEIKGHVKYDVIKSLVLALGYFAFDKLHRIGGLSDWEWALVLFLGSLAVLMYIHRPQVRSPSSPHGFGSHALFNVAKIEEWTEAGRSLRQVINRIFTHEQVVLDGREFIGCSFTHCDLFYDGTLPTAINNCTFDSDTLTHFHSHNPAMAQWIELLRRLDRLKPEVHFALTPLDNKSNDQ